MVHSNQIISLNVRDTLAPGLIVYDVVAQEVGTLDSVDMATGWFVVKTADSPHMDLYVPFSLITNIDPHDLFVSKSRDELLASHTAPPSRTITMKEVDGTETAITTEPSGYDDSPVVVEQAEIGLLRMEISAGQRVYTSDGEDLGSVKQYDRITGWMRIEKGNLSDKRDTMVPITLVNYIDPITNQVYLAVRKSDVQRMQHLEPAETIVARAQDTEST